MKVIRWLFWVVAWLWAPISAWLLWRDVNEPLETDRKD